MEEVFRKLFGKAEGQAKRASSPDAQSTSTEPEASRAKAEKPNPVTGPVNEIETAADPARIGDDESTATDSTRPQAEPAQQVDIARDADDTESQKETGHETQNEVQQPEPGAKDDAGASTPLNALVIPVKNPRVKDYYLGLKAELLYLHGKNGILTRGGIFPVDLDDIMKEEELPLQLLLAVVQLRISTWQNLEERKAAGTSEGKKTQQRGRHKG
jgi:hypothetical protein